MLLKQWCVKDAVEKGIAKGMIAWIDFGYNHGGKYYLKKEEFDFELYGIHPTYNVDTLSPNWEIPNFFTALYFALFYTRPDYEVYRKCANPNCGRLFKVKTTNSSKQYHDTACQNAAAQMRHRKSRK